MNITKPEMIIFDMGHTLIYDVDIDYLNAQRAIFEYVDKNPHNATAEQVYEFEQNMYATFYDHIHAEGYEVTQIQRFRVAYERLGITFKVGYDTLEKVFWDNMSKGGAMPNIDALLDYLEKSGIRTAVLSNTGYSAEALDYRFNKLLAKNNFEFIISTADYGVRKPCRHLFETALEKAKLPAEKVWYCGDRILADVNGSASVGITPVLYDCKSVDNVYGEQELLKTDNEYIHIHDWLELIDVLKNIDNM